MKSCSSHISLTSDYRLMRLIRRSMTNKLLTPPTCNQPGKTARCVPDCTHLPMTTWRNKERSDQSSGGIIVNCCEWQWAVFKVYVNYNSSENSRIQHGIKHNRKRSQIREESSLMKTSKSGVNVCSGGMRSSKQKLSWKCIRSDKKRTLNIYHENKAYKGN